MKLFPDVANQFEKSLLEFIEKFALFFESRGLTRTQGRILGYLAVAEQPLQTLDEIALALNLSVSTISPELKRLVDLSLANRLKRKDVEEIEGERGYVFQVTGDTWLAAIDDKGAASAAFVMLANEGLKILENEPLERGKLLREMKILFEFLGKRMPELIDEYREYRKSLE